MPGAPIGVTFVPSQENAAEAPRQGQLTGNIQDAYRLLTLRLPRLLGAKAITPGSNLTAPGASGLPSSATFGGQTGPVSPDAAILRAIFMSMLGDGGGDMGGAPSSAMAAGSALSSAAPQTRIVPGNDTSQRRVDPSPSPSSPWVGQVEPPPSTVFNDGTDARMRGQAEDSPFANKPAFAMPNTLSTKKKTFGGGY